MTMLAMPSTNAVRAGAVCGLAALLLFREQADAAVAALFRGLCATPWFTHDSWEPVLSTLSFFPAFVLWFVLDKYVPSAHKYHIHQKPPRQWWAVSATKVGEGEFTGVPILVAYILPLAVFDQLYPRRILDHEAPTAFRVLGEVAGLLLVYDFLFYFVHRVCHEVPLLYRHIHKLHHKKTVTRPNDTTRLTFAEEFLDVMCSIVAVNLLKAHPLSRSIYDVVIVYLLVELHCGYDMPWMLHNVVPFGLVAGPPVHDRHHVVGKGNYQKFFTYLDELLGTSRPVPLRVAQRLPAAKTLE